MSRRVWTEEDVDTAGREPDGGWHANDRRPIPAEAIEQAKRILALLGDAQPDCLSWDASGGIWLEWDREDDRLCVSVFKTITIVLYDRGLHHESYWSQDPKLTADGIVSLLSKGD